LQRGGVGQAAPHRLPTLARSGIDSKEDGCASHLLSSVRGEMDGHVPPSCGTCEVAPDARPAGRPGRQEGRTWDGSSEWGSAARQTDGIGAFATGQFRVGVGVGGVNKEGTPGVRAPDGRAGRLHPYLVPVAFLGPGAWGACCWVTCEGTA